MLEKEGKTIEIRKVEKKDLIEVAKIKVEAWRDAYKDIVDEEYLKTMDYKKTAEKWYKNFSDENFIVAVEDNRILGFCRYGDRIDELNRFEDYNGEIYALYIAKDYRKKGVGKQLVKYASKQLEMNEKGNFLIWCLGENNEALKFYKKIGGRFLGEKKAKIGNKTYSEFAFGYENFK